MIDLDARRAEIAATPRDPLRIGGEAFDLPVELPGDVLAPFLAPNLGLVELLADAIANSDDEEGDDIGEMVFDALAKNPTLPTGLVEAAKQALKALIGEDRYPAFIAARPTVPEYLLIARELFAEYGMSLGDFFVSPSSSADEETNSKQTSPEPTAAPTETSVASGDAPVTPDSSASAG